MYTNILRTHGVYISLNYNTCYDVVYTSGDDVYHNIRSRNNIQCVISFNVLYDLHYPKRLQSNNTYTIVIRFN